MRIKWRKDTEGQGLVEFALVLPFLILLILGMAELGYAMYHYMVVANANREGVRLAARGRFTDADVASRIVSAGGMDRLDGGDYEHILRGMGDEPNFGAIITHITLDSGSNWWETVNFYVTGTIATEDGSMVAIQPSDSRITADLVESYQTNVDLSERINDIRMDNDYAATSNRLVIVETFMNHETLMALPDFIPIPDRYQLYFMSTMRVTLDSRNR
jgi:Flp pilus assembly protein TadG